MRLTMRKGRRGNEEEEITDGMEEEEKKGMIDGLSEKKVELG